MDGQAVRLDRLRCDRVLRLLTRADELRVQAEYRRSERRHCRVIRWLERAAARENGAQPEAAGANAAERAALTDLLQVGLNNLAVLYKFTGRFDEARKLYRRALKLHRAGPTPGAHVLASIYHNLGGLEHARGAFRRGEPLARESVRLRLGSMPRDDAALCADLIAWAALLDGLRRFDESEPIYRQALSILERTLRPEHLELAYGLNNLAAVRFARGDLAEAEALYRRSLAIKTRALGADHPEVATTLNNLAVLRARKGDAFEARNMLIRALDILTARLGASHPHAQACRKSLDALNNEITETITATDVDPA